MSELRNALILLLFINAVLSGVLAGAGRTRVRTATTEFLFGAKIIKRYNIRYIQRYKVLSDASKNFHFSWERFISHESFLLETYGEFELMYAA